MTNIVNGPLTGDTLPAMVELELGIMEPDMLGEARAIPAAPPQYTALTNYLGRNSGRVHLFRQQIPIRGAVR